MPNDEHVALLRRGAAAWNAWWAEQDETPDLSQAGLRGLDLSGYNLSRADLRGADLRGASLRGANSAGEPRLSAPATARIPLGARRGCLRGRGPAPVSLIYRSIRTGR